MRKSKALLTRALAASLVVSNIAVLPVYAEPNDKTAGSSVTLTIASDSNATPPDEGGGGGGDTPVDPETFSVTVPAIIPISMDLDGNIQVPDDLEVINGNDSAIKCTAIDITLDSQWQATDFDELSLAKMKSKEAENTKQFSIALRGDKLKSNGSLKVTESSWNFAANDSLPLNVRVRIPKQTEVFEADLATIEYTFDWSDVKDSSKADIGADISVQKPKVYTVTFEVPEGATIKNGTGTVKVESGQTVTLPEVELSSLRYEPGDWKLADGTVFNNSTPVTADTTVTLETTARAENPKNWFVASGNTLTGLSDEYLNMIDAPTDLVIPNNIGGSSITSIASGAFKDKNLLTSIVVPDTVTTIAANAFTGCSDSLKIDVSYAYRYSIVGSPWGATSEKVIWNTVVEDWDTNPMTSDELVNAGLAFNGVDEVHLNSNESQKISMPTTVDGKKITKIGSRTSNSVINSNLYEVEIPNTVITVGDSAFKNCNNLKNIVIPNSVHNIEDNAFYMCTNIDILTIPDSVTSIGNNAFKEVYMIKYHGYATGNPWGALIVNEYIRPEWDTNPVRSSDLDDLGFIYSNGMLKFNMDKIQNTGMTKIVIPTSVDTHKITTIQMDSIKMNRTVTEITIPETFELIYNNVFNYFFGLESLTIPNSVSAIGDSAFYGIKEIRYSGPATGSPWGAKSVVPNN